MHTITEKQIKQIAKQISKEYKEIQYSKVLEVIAHSLGYKDYNALYTLFGNKPDSTQTIKETPITHTQPIKEPKQVVLQGKVCPNCNGAKGWEVAIETSPENVMWYSDGEFFELGYKECFWCSGTGRVTNKRIKEMKKLKRDNEYGGC